MPAAVPSASAPCNIARSTAAACHPLVVGYPAHANNIELNIVLSDVAEEDTDMEDAHASSPPPVFIYLFV